MNPVRLQLIILLLVSSTLSLAFGSFQSLPASEEVSQNVRRGDPSTVVEVEIPNQSTVDKSFPRLKLVNDSSEFHDEDEKIAKDGTMISGVASRFGKRSARQYPSHPAMMSSVNSGNPYYTTRNSNRYNMRYDNRRNSLEPSDISSSAPSSWGSKWFSQLKRRTGMMMNPMMSSYERQQQYQNQGVQEEPDMAATYGGGGGWGQSSHYGKGSVNKSAVGLLGFLSLLSLIQNVINQTSTMNGRRRRDVSAVSTGVSEDADLLDWDDSILEATSLTPYMLPMISAVTNAQNGLIPIECTLEPICVFNTALVDALGNERGKLVGRKISDTLSKSLQTTCKRWKTKDWDINGRILRAGMAGRSGKKCTTLYKSCPARKGIPNLDSF